MESIAVLTVVVFGMGNRAGAVVGAFVLALLPEILRDVARRCSRPCSAALLDPEVLRMLLLSLAMILMMLLRPAGMIPARARYCHDHHLSHHLNNTPSGRPRSDHAARSPQHRQALRRPAGLSDVSLTIRKGRGPRPDRPQRRRQDHLLQRPHRCLHPDGGEFVFNGSEPSGKPHQVVGRGIARTFQNIRLFRDLTALENVMAGHHIRSRAGIWACCAEPLHPPRRPPDHRARLTNCCDYVGIERRAPTWCRRTSPTATSAA